MADESSRIVRSPRQASSIFGLGGARPPRQKNLFVVNFRKNGDTGGGLSAGTWNKDLGFLVKSVDRPSVEPKTEELNQYNKKRVVHTGYKIGTTRITLYDTADSMVMRMWAEYSKYYFGDFRHGTATTSATSTTNSSSTDWQFDTVLPKFNDSSNSGFGFAPQSSTSTAASTTSDYTVPFFFDTIAIYQVFGKKFVQFDLVNPKITSFDPDDLDYSNSEVATFTMQITCEAVLYKNDFQPQDIGADSFLNEAFASTSWFKGDTVEYSDASSATASVTYPASADTAAQIAQVPASALGYTNPVVTRSVPLQGYDSSFSAGSLNAYGQYNFGSTSSASGDVRSLATDLALAASTNPALAAVLNLNNRALAAETGVRAITQPYMQPSYISQAQYDAASAAVQAVGGLSQSESVLAQQLTYGILSAALATGSAPRDQLYNRKPPQVSGTVWQAGVGYNVGDVVSYAGNTYLCVQPHGSTGVFDAGAFALRPVEAPPNSWSSTNGTGLALTNQTYGIINAQRAPSSQIGVNEHNAVQRVSPAGPAAVPVSGGGNVTYAASAAPAPTISNVKPGYMGPLD